MYVDERDSRTKNDFYLVEGAKGKTWNWKKSQPSQIINVSKISPQISVINKSTKRKEY
jgi:hypothetical protein